MKLDGALERTTLARGHDLATRRNPRPAEVRLGLDELGKSDSISVIGVPVKWEGNIPYVPQIDFHLKAETKFTPWAFAPNVAKATGQSPKLRMFEVNLLDMLGIPSQISKGGIALDVSGDLTATYQTERIRIEPAKVTEAPISSATGTTTRAFPGGAFVEYDVFPEGRVDYAGTLHLIPTFFVEVLGKDFNIPVVDIPVSFDVGKQDFVFDPVRVHVPLPDLEQVVSEARVRHRRRRRVEDHDAHPAQRRRGQGARHRFLRLRRSLKAFSSTTAEVLVASQKSGTYSVKFSPAAPGKATSVLTLVTERPGRALHQGDALGPGPGLRTGRRRLADRRRRPTTMAAAAAERARPPGGPRPGSSR